MCSYIPEKPLLADATSSADISRGLGVSKDGLGHAWTVHVNSSCASGWVSILLTNEGLQDDDLLGDLSIGGQVGTKLGDCSLAGFAVNLMRWMLDFIINKYSKFNAIGGSEMNG